MVARPTASKGWRLDRKHGRRRPAAGVTTPEQQRPVRQEEAATRHGHSRRRYVNDVRPTTSPSHFRLDGDTRGRQYVSSSGSETHPSHSVGLTLRQLQRRLLWLLSFATELSQLSYSSSNYTVSRLFTLTVSQNYYDGPSPRRFVKYIYTQ